MVVVAIVVAVLVNVLFVGAAFAAVAAVIAGTAVAVAAAVAAAVYVAFTSSGGSPSTTLPAALFSLRCADDVVVVCAVAVAVHVVPFSVANCFVVLEA